MTKTVRVMATDKQRRFLYHVLEDRECRVVAYGGARFGGKTFANCLAAVLACLKWEGIRVLMLRRVTKSAEMNLGEEIERICRLLDLPRGMVRHLVARRQYHFPNGSYIQLDYCRLKDDWQIQQGLQFALIFFEEATQFPEVDWDKIGGSNRSTNPRCPAKRIMTCNPGGIGMEWVRRRVIDPATREKGTVFIQSRLRDCLATLERDPGYARRALRNLTEHLRRQWEEGDWSAIEGQYFSQMPYLFCEVDVPEWAEIHAGVDEGHWPSAFAAVWVAKWREANGRLRLHVLRGVKRHRLNLRDQAALGLEEEAKLPLPVRARWADPSSWKHHSTPEGMSITTAHIWAQHGWVVSPAFHRDRVAGWMLLRTLTTDGQVNEDGIITPSTLTISPKGAPALKAEWTDAVHSGNDDDIDPECEDHSLDALRYVVTSIYMSAQRPPQKETRMMRRLRLRKEALRLYR